MTMMMICFSEIEMPPNVVDRADQRRNRLVARALRHLDEVGQRDRHADRGDQRRQAEGTAQRPVCDALDRPIPQARHQHRNHKHRQQQNSDRKTCKDGCENEKDDESSETTEHKDIAMGEIDHADNAVNHRVANSDKAIDGSERQPIEELLDEILHMSFPLDASQNCCISFWFCNSAFCRNLIGRMHTGFRRKCEDKKVLLRSDSCPTGRKWRISEPKSTENTAFSGEILARNRLRINHTGLKVAGDFRAALRSLFHKIGS